MNGWQPSMLRWRRPAGTISGTAPTPPMSPAVCAGSAESISGSAWRGIAKRQFNLRRILRSRVWHAAIPHHIAISVRSDGQSGRFSRCALAPFWVEPVRSVPHSARGVAASCCRNPESRKEHMIKRLIGGPPAWSWRSVLALGGVALAASPAQALTGVPCDDGDA
jgi:hypothetical protein